MSITTPISEIYGPVIQGEGMLIGQATIFIRTGGCDYLCDWCDSLYAVEAKHKATWVKMTPTEILKRVQALVRKPLLITLSGGNPALHDLDALIDGGHALGYQFAIETQGTIMRPWASKLDAITISPKPPSSKMVTDWKQLDDWLSEFSLAQKCVKVVVFDEHDLEYAGIVRDHAIAYDVPMFVQTGTPGPYRSTDTHESLTYFREDIYRGTNWLVNRVIDLGWYDVRVLPQMHALLGGSKRGI